MNQTVAQSPTATATAIDRTRPATLGPEYSRANGWTPVPCRDPRGYWTYCILRDSGDIVLQMGSRPHGSDAGQTIGWAWTGWKKARVYASPGTVFCAVVKTGTVSVRPNGGTTVPRAFLSLHPEGGGRPVESSIVLQSNRTQVVCVPAPRAGYYNVHAEFNIRSVYSGSAKPYCEILGKFETVVSSYGYFQPSSFAETATTLQAPADAGPELEEMEFGDPELLEQLTARQEAAGGEALAGPEAFAER